MATGLEINPVIDFDELESSFESVSTDVPTLKVRLDEVPALHQRLMATRTTAMHSRAPNAAALSTLIRRSLRTVAPFVIADMLALSVCAVWALGIVGLLYPSSVKVMAVAVPAALALLLVAYWMSDLYTEIWVHPVIEFRQLTLLNTIGLLGAAAGGLLRPPFPLWCLGTWIAALFAVPVGRMLVRRIFSRFSWWGHRTLVISSGAEGEVLARTLSRAEHSGLRPALMTDPEGRCRTSTLRVVNDTTTVESIVRAEGIRHAVISLPDVTNIRLAELIGRYAGQIPHLLVLSDASTLPALLGASRSSGRLSGLEVRNGLLLSTLQSIKRAIDVVIAAMTLIAGLPLLFVIAILIKLTSRGPLFYGHKRIGRDSDRFKVWKFRTMHPNGDAILREHLAKYPEAQLEWDRDQKLKCDPRVTAAGKLLRMTSFDELPQVWNVLRGDMSLVGPRPIVDDEVARYGKVYSLYTSVKPGITGLWQVSGRNDIDYADRVELDRFYIRHWSPWLDVYILAKTAVVLVSRNGAY